MTYLRNLITAATALGIDLDKFENAATGGNPDQTISMRDAIANLHKRLWAHLACLFLSVAVQWNHCADQLAGKPMGETNYLRAIIALIGVPAALIMGAAHAVHLVMGIS